MLRRSWQRNALLALGSTVLVCVVAEAVLRLAWQPGTYAPVIRTHATYGWSLQPGTRLHGVDTDRGLDYHIAVNRLGHRDPERQLAKPRGVRRVLFLGDSMLFGAGVELGERCTDLLAARLGAGVEVLNSAVSGWGTDQEFLYLCHEGFALHPDVVVIALCMSNDVINNMLDHAFLDVPSKPRFTCDDDGALRLEPFQVRPPPRPETLKRVLKHSRLLNYVGRHARLLRTRLQPPRPRATPPRYYPEDLESDRSHWSVYKLPYSERFERAFRVTEALVAAAHDSCRAHHAALLIFAFPEKVEVDPEARRAELAHHRFEPAWFDLEAPYARLGSFCERRALPFVYPLEDFRRASQEAPLYFAHDPHPNAAGQAQAARSLEGPVRAALAPAPQSGFRNHTEITTSRQGPG